MVMIKTFVSKHIIQREAGKVIVPLVDVIQIMVAAFQEEVMDRSRKVR